MNKPIGNHVYSQGGRFYSSGSNRSISHADALITVLKRAATLDSPEQKLLFAVLEQCIADAFDVLPPVSSLNKGNPSPKKYWERYTAYNQRVSYKNDAISYLTKRVLRGSNRHLDFLNIEREYVELLVKEMRDHLKPALLLKRPRLVWRKAKNDNT